MVDTPVYGLTLRYIWLNLALFGSQGWYLSAGRPGVRRVSGRPGVPGRAQKRGLEAWVGPWHYQSVGGWVPGWVLPSPPTLATAPRTARMSTSTVPLTVARTLGTCTYDRFPVDQGDPRGRIRTGYRGVPVRARSGCAGPAVTLRLSSPAPPSAPARLSIPQFFSISQYFSVYLSI